MDSGVEGPRHLPVTEITAETDTRDILDHARQQGVDKVASHVTTLEELFRTTVGEVVEE